MKLCSDDHDEVCFDGRFCPVCEVRSDLQADVDRLRSDLNDAEKTIEKQDEELRAARA